MLPSLTNLNVMSTINKTRKLWFHLGVILQQWEHDVKRLQNLNQNDSEMKKAFTRSINHLANKIPKWSLELEEVSDFYPGSEQQKMDFLRVIFLRQVASMMNSTETTHKKIPPEANHKTGSCICDLESKTVINTSTQGDGKSNSLNSTTIVSSQSQIKSQGDLGHPTFSINFLYISADDIKFAEPIHRYERHYKWPKEKTRIRQIHSLYYSVTPKKKFKNKSLIYSNFVVISDPAETIPCVVYQNFHEIEQTDFSYTCTGDGKIQHLFAIRNSEKFSEKENAIMLIMYRIMKKDVPGSDTELACVSSIATDKMKLKPLFSFPGSLHPVGSQFFALNQRARVAQKNIKEEVKEFFRFIILVDKGKLLYARVESTVDWFTRLADSNHLFIMDTANIKTTHDLVGLVFDTADQNPARLMIVTRLSDTCHLQICREQEFEKTIRLLPEFHFSSDAFRTHFRPEWESSSSIHRFFFNSRLGFVGWAVFTPAKNSGEKGCVKVVLLDFFTSMCREQAKNNHSEFGDLETIQNEKLSLQPDSEEDPATVVVQTHCATFPGIDWSPDLKVANTEFEEKGTHTHLTAFAVTGSNLVFWLLVRRKPSDQNKINPQPARLLTKVIEVKLGPGPEQSKSSLQASNASYLNALGQSIHIEKAGQTQLKARVPISFGAKSTSDLELELGKWLNL